MTTGIVMLLFAVLFASAAVVFSTAAALAGLERTPLRILLGAILLLYLALLWTRPPSLVVSNLAVLGASAVAAAAIGRSFGARQTIIAFSIAASIADIVSFTVGPTHRLLGLADRGSGSLISYLAVSVPTARTVLPVVGVGDLLVLGIFFVALERIGVALLARSVVPAAGLSAALAVGLLVGGAFGIPFMAVAVLIYLGVSARRTAQREAGA